jgi:hypothetical protein
LPQSVTGRSKTFLTVSSSHFSVFSSAAKDSRKKVISKKKVTVIYFSEKKA